MIRNIVIAIIGLCLIFYLVLPWIIRQIGMVCIAVHERRWRVIPLAVLIGIAEASGFVALCLLVGWLLPKWLELDDGGEGRTPAPAIESSENDAALQRSLETWAGLVMDAYGKYAEELGKERGSLGTRITQYEAHLEPIAESGEWGLGKERAGVLWFEEAEPEIFYATHWTVFVVRSDGAWVIQAAVEDEGIDLDSLSSEKRQEVEQYQYWRGQSMKFVLETALERYGTQREN